ncbi:pilus assembly protein [Burkholderiaceae bacterium 16]|nr:pilus assembly protein [Burkholderiaceae bacterium 16]
MPEYWTRYWHRHRNVGATLAELLTCLAVLSILAASAYPSWHHLLARQQVVLAANRLAGSLALARATSVARRTEVLFGPLPRKATLDQGWRLTLAPAGSAATDLSPSDSGAPDRYEDGLLAQVELRSACLRIALRSTTQGNHTLHMAAVGYSRSEQGGFLAATFTVTCQGEQRQLRLGAHGRIRLCTPGQDTDCGGLDQPPAALTLED